MATSLETTRFAVPAVDNPILMRMLLHELAAFPLYAAAGVGLGILLARSKPARRHRGLLVAPFLLGWCVATLTGLVQDDEFDAWPWLLWAVPFVAAGTAIALSGLSADVWAVPPVEVGDWGWSAGITLLVSAEAYAVVLNLLGYLAARRWSRPVSLASRPDELP